MKFLRNTRNWIVLLLFTVMVSHGLPERLNGAQEGPCEEGLKRCMADALVASMAGAYVGIAYASWCTVGYIWCVKYVD